MKQTVIIVDELLFDKLLKKVDSISSAVQALSAKKDDGLKEKWLTTEEVCHILHISKRRLQQMRTRDEILYTKVGKKVYYKASDIEKLLEKASE